MDLDPLRLPALGGARFGADPSGERDWTVVALPREIPGASICAVLDERVRQVAEFGHTPEDDASLPVAFLPIEARKYIEDARDEMTRHKHGWQRRAQRKLAKAGALLLASLDRLALEPPEGERS